MKLSGDNAFHSFGEERQVGDGTVVGEVSWMCTPGLFKTSLFSLQATWIKVS